MNPSAADIKQGRNLDELCTRARRIRDRSKGRIVSFSPKVFIPLTQLCRDFCGYCVFRRSPREAENLYMTPEQVLKVAKTAQQAGCREALFVLGERPERRYPEAGAWLRANGYESTLQYLRAMCSLVLAETDLYPHSNPGTMTRAELESLKDVNASMGLMLETASARLGRPGGPHEHAPSKRPTVRLRTLELAGQLKIPLTTGLLIGIGETADERIRALLQIKALHARYGHIQEVIIQNFRAKPGTPMAGAPEATPEEFLETVALARIILGAEMNIQAPPNLAGTLSRPGCAEDCDRTGYLSYLEAGINDWGGISPVTMDYVNPEAPWPHLGQLHRQLASRNYQLRARFPVYPEYILHRDDFLPLPLHKRLRSEADDCGYFSGYEFGDGIPAPVDPESAHGWGARQ